MKRTEELRKKRFEGAYEVWREARNGLALAGMTEIKQDNVYIRDVYPPAFND